MNAWFDAACLTLAGALILIAVGLPFIAALGVSAKETVEDIARAWRGWVSIILLFALPVAAALALIGVTQ